MTNELQTANLLLNSQLRVIQTQYATIDNMTCHLI